jgi:hypothetical protein
VTSLHQAQGRLIAAGIEDHESRTTGWFNGADYPIERDRLVLHIDFAAGMAATDGAGLLQLLVGFLTHRQLSGWTSAVARAFRARCQLLTTARTLFGKDVAILPPRSDALRQIVNANLASNGSPCRRQFVRANSVPAL